MKRPQSVPKDLQQRWEPLPKAIRNIPTTAEMWEYLFPSGVKVKILVQNNFFWANQPDGTFNFSETQFPDP